MPALSQMPEPRSVEPEPTDLTDNVIAKFAELDRLRMRELHPDYIRTFKFGGGFAGMLYDHAALAG